MCKYGDQALENTLAAQIPFQSIYMYTWMLVKRAKTQMNSVLSPQEARLLEERLNVCFV